jgi:zinc transport system substrate-binding protein
MIQRLLTLVPVLFLLAAACTGPESKGDGLKVIVSLQPLAGFVEKVGGDKVHVAMMVPPGASPHTYEPRPSQLKEVSTADLFVKVGSGVEFELVWMDRIIGVNKKMPVVDCSVGVELIGADVHNEGHDEGREDVARRHAGADPHIWLSTRNAGIMVNNIYEGLALTDPANSDYYAGNRDRFFAELDALDNEIERILSKKKTRRVMVYHPAWAYLARDYGLEEVPIERAGKEASPAGIAGVVRQAREHGIKVIFASPEFSTRSAEVVAKEIGGRVVLLSPLEKDYIKNLKKVAEALKED